MRVLRWLQGQKSWKHDFDITGDQKSPPCQVNFMVGFCDLKGPKPFSRAQKAGCPAIFREKK